MVTSKVLAFLILLTALISCGKKETFIPLYGPETAAEQQIRRTGDDGNGSQIGPNGGTGTPRDQKVYYLRGKYYLSDIQVNRAVDGPIFISNFGNLLADIIVRIGGNFEVDMDPIPIDISDINKDLIKSIVIKDMKLEVLDNPEKADLKFIKKFQIYVNTEDETDTNDSDAGNSDDVNSTDESDRVTDGNKKEEILLVSYDRTNDYDYETSKACDWMCIDLNVNRVNILDYVGTSKELIVRPSLKIGATPKEPFLIGGYMEFEIGLTLPL
ncbi:MAG: hypothetical protein KC493_15905 [Bacteriovoracaceae bacterium]|nr:hypothetical protein [Bacteriovoracaceae bacterium]